MRYGCLYEGCPDPHCARGYCGRHYARLLRTGSVELREPSAPAWKRAPLGNQRYWTKPRCLAALKQYAAENPGQLPTSDHVYNDLKKGRMDLPPAQRVLEYWHTMVRAWTAAGVERNRLKILGTRWTKAEKAFLLEHAGVATLTQIAKALGRSYGSCKTMIGSKGMGITARRNQGFLSAAELSKEYGAPYHRVCDLLKAGIIKGRRHPRRNTWLVDPNLSAKAIAALKAVKQTHKTRPSDQGVRVEAAER